MINAKILSSTSTFNAVKYNDGKTKPRDNKPETGKLLCMRNFESMATKTDWSVAEIKAYFKEYGRNNIRIKNQQFHAVLSVKGKVLNEKHLENAAHQYMSAMGYKDVPYIVYFHNDTDNNHVHIVSSRVGQDGRKINSSFEKQRSLGVIQDVSKMFGLEIPKNFEVAKNLAIKFKFSTEAQFNLLMEREGFKVFSKDDQYDYMRNGKKEGSINKEFINKAITDPKLKLEDASSRIKQIRALIYKYAPKYSPEIKIENTKLPGQRHFDPKVKGTFGSDLSDFLKDKFGIDMIYHGNIDKGKPYGYSIIDNTDQSVFKGSEILSLQKLVEAELSLPVIAQGEKNIDSKKETDYAYNEKEDLSFAAEGESHQNTGDQWIQELNDLFKEITFFADSGEENSTHNMKKKRKNSQDIDLER